MKFSTIPTVTHEFMLRQKLPVVLYSLNRISDTKSQLLFKAEVVPVTVTRYSIENSLACGYSMDIFVAGKKDKGSLFDLFQTESQAQERVEELFQMQADSLHRIQFEHAALKTSLSWIVEFCGSHPEWMGSDDGTQTEFEWLENAAKLVGEAGDAKCVLEGKWKLHGLRQILQSSHEGDEGIALFDRLSKANNELEEELHQLFIDLNMQVRDQLKAEPPEEIIGMILDAANSAAAVARQ